MTNLLLIIASQAPIVNKEYKNALQWAKANFPNVDYNNIITIDCMQDKEVDFLQLVSPSLFSAEQFIYVKHLEGAGADLISQIEAFLQENNSSSVVLFQHSGVQKGSGLVKKIKQAGAITSQPKPVKYDNDRIDFVNRAFSEGGVNIDYAAARALVDAFGDDLDELDSACKQFINDNTANSITKEDIDKYFQGRKQVTIFEICDAAAAGDAKKALDLYRNAIFIGEEPISVVSALAYQFRKITKVASYKVNNKTPADLKMSPWQIQNTQKLISKWNSKSLAKVFYDLSQTEEILKTNSKIDKVYLVEELVLKTANLAA